MTNLTPEEKHAFKEISYSVGDGKPHELEDIKGIAIPKNKIQEYMLLFTQTKPPLYSFNGTYYVITKPGMQEFKKMRDSLERVAAGRLVY